MEATPLLRFVCATFAMRRQWEGRNGNVQATGPLCAQDRDEENAVTAVSIGSVGDEIDVVQVVDSETDDEAVLLDGDRDGARRYLVPVLAAVKAAQTRGCALDESVRRVVADMCENATKCGILQEVVSALVMDLVDVDDQRKESEAQGLAEVLLLLCFERASGGEVEELVPTRYCSQVVGLALGIQSDILELENLDQMYSQPGVRWLNRTLETVTEYLQSAYRESETVVL